MPALPPYDNNNNKHHDIMIRKTIRSGIILLTAFFASTMNIHAETPAGTASPKILVAYFSYSGNTRKLAQQIQKLTGGDLFEIQTVKAYPKEYTPCTEVAKKEKEDNARPELKTKVKDMKQYQVVFVGCPSWWHTAPMAVFTFLESYDFAGKTVIPFCTHESREDGAFAAIEKLTPKSRHLKGFDTHGNSVDNDEPKVKKWLKEIGLTRKD